ncbi:MAG: divalent-cation tolerance protein CutA [Proteobacteria bacterium]|nr:divalent-cation tolerance protein CutA [Pseudomonadota bacterium]
MRLVISTAPVDKAGELAHKLVGERLAACVNIVPKVRSIYTWKGVVEDDEEALMFIKTTPDRVQALSTRLKELHPYDVPEIVSLNLNDNEGNPDYLAWIKDSVRQS